MARGQLRAVKRRGWQDLPTRMSAKRGQKRGSYKPPSVQALVISKRQQDKSMRHIARETGLDRETVRNILTQPEIAQSLAEARSASIKALPEIARMVHEDTLAERDRELGFRILDKAGVYPEQNAPHYSFHDDARLQVVIAELLPVQISEKTTPPAPVFQPGTNGTSQQDGAPASAESLPGVRSPAPAQTPTVHPPACECDACVCLKCGKQRDPRDAGGAHVALEQMRLRHAGLVQCRVGGHLGPLRGTTRTRAPAACAH